MYVENFSTRIADDPSTTTAPIDWLLAITLSSNVLTLVTEPQEIVAVNVTLVFVSGV